ncbi:MAG: hypothetical protein M3R02_12315 [Chloroflexota bacterium]|nr:hypothetical protein [Chloroflexota bacterium]
MSTITRTIRQWTATARQLERPTTSIREHRLAARIRKAVAADPFAHPDQVVAVTVAPEEQATIEQVAPLTALWMPAAPRVVALEQEAGAAVAAAEAIIRGHQRRQG